MARRRRNSSRRWSSCNRTALRGPARSARRPPEPPPPGPQDFIATTRAVFRQRRDMVVAALDAIDGIHCHLPDGAFYVFASCADLFGLRTPTGRVIRSSDDWIGHLLDSQDLAALQGSAYGVGTHFRLSCASSG